MIRQRRFVVDDVDGTIDAQPRTGNPDAILATGRTLYSVPKPVQRASDAPVTVAASAGGLTVMSTVMNPDGSMTVTLSDGTAKTIPASTVASNVPAGQPGSFDFGGFYWFLNQPIGPLPLWVWGAIAGGGVAVYYLFLKKGR